MNKEFGRALLNHSSLNPAKDKLVVQKIINTNRVLVTINLGKVLSCLLLLQAANSSETVTIRLFRNLRQAKRSHPSKVNLSL